MEIEKKPSTNEETYRIYNYFKGHPGILLSAVSVLTAVLAVVANALAFLYQYIKLQKWNINILKWGLPFEGNAIYYPALSLLYILLVLGLCNILLNIFENSFSFSALLTYLHCTHLNGETKYFPTLEKQLTETGIQMQRNGWIILVVAKSVLALFIYVLVIFVHLLLTDNLFSFSPLLIVAWILVLIMLLFFTRTLAKSEVKDFLPSSKLRKSLRQAKKNPSIHTESMLTKEEFTKCIGKCSALLTRKRKKHRLSDQSVSHYIIFVVTVFITEISLLCFTAITTTENTFWIYTDSQSSYVVAYRHDSQYVLTEARINDSTITIELSSQRVLQSDDLTIQQHQFEDVIWEKGDHS
ncbi:hypothetical protein [uncultured Subdoligranulum sp.]|uniref:hypothetical protein n=1 Tax=uncultured Subdoligranulum sp. TaxID=512298 RepID=UPI0032087F43